jgi:hypothetical protein
MGVPELPERIGRFQPIHSSIGPQTPAKRCSQIVMLDLESCTALILLWRNVQPPCAHGERKEVGQMPVRYRRFFACCH